jgi:hypothetical protein
VTTSDHWELQGHFQFIGAPDIRHLVGLDCWADPEAKSGRIFPWHVTVVDGTEAVLANRCKVGDQVLKLKGAESWPSKLIKYPPHFTIDCVAFGPNVLPNFTTACWIRQCVVKGEIVEVELTEAIKQSWPAGTQVRMQASGGTYVYGHGGTIPSEWTQIVMTHQSHQLRPGTKAVKIVVLCCHSIDNSESPPDKLRIRNLRWQTLP